MLLSSVKRRHILCTGEHGKWNIKCIIFYSHECLCEILQLISTVVCQMLTLYCGKGGRGIQKYFLYAQMTIQCVECAITEIYLLLVARNLYKYILLLYIFWVLRHISLLVASLLVARNWSLAWAWWNIIVFNISKFIEIPI